MCVVEFATVTRDADGHVVYHVFSRTELEALIKEAEPILKAAEAEVAASGDI